jgi:two-component system chemotaxis response regulator CheY
VALFDIDFFKRYNDTYGHPAGDEALRRVAQAIASSVRSGDMVYRYGGEEFLVLLPEQTVASATVAVDRIRTAVQDLGLVHPDNPPVGVVTISGGVAESGPAETLGIDEWLHRADLALYRAKALGRNRIVVFDRTLEAA